MKHFYTIKETTTNSKFGFESSQIARQEICKELGVKHTTVIVGLQIIQANIYEAFRELGFDDIYHVILDHSDIARDEPSVSDTNFKDVEKINYTKNGYVGTVIYTDGIIEAYTSQLLYRFNSKTFEFTLYNKDSVALNGKLAYENYLEFNGKSQWELLVEYLANNSSTDDIFVVDMIEKYPAQLKRFFQNTGRTLHAYTHYNILDKIMAFRYQNWCKNIVASPVIANQLTRQGQPAYFLPPIYADEVKEKNYESITDWCIVGNMSVVKRVNMAIEAFRDLPHLKLTIYGAMDETDLPDNITYAGIVSHVPYEKHQGYISCSISECFANSAVEASASGLVCLLSNTDIAHRYYAMMDDNVELFDNARQLRIQLQRLSQIQKHSSTFAQEYTKEKVIQEYERLFL